MAQFTRTHGDFQPVLWLDQPEYTTGAVNAVSSALTVQPQGPKLDFFTIELADVAANTTIALQTIQAVQQLATIHIYEFTNTTTDTLALAVYPTGGWTTATLEAAVDAATGGSSTVTATATFTN
jgi:hypothetical protein